METYRKKIINSFIGMAAAASVAMVIFLHNAWGDERYQLKADVIVAEIRRIDTELTVIDQEILYAETERQKRKFIAMKAIFEREKEALRAKLAQQSS